MFSMVKNPCSSAFLGKLQGLWGVYDIQPLYFSRTRDLEQHVPDPLLFWWFPLCHLAPILSSSFWSHKGMPEDPPVSKWNSNLFCLQIPAVTRRSSLWTSLSWLWRWEHNSSLRRRREKERASPQKSCTVLKNDFLSPRQW